MGYSFDPDMSKRYDDWLTSEPDMKDTVFRCEHCKTEFYPGDDYYYIEGENLCPECAEKWFDSMRRTATEDECFED